MSNKDFSGVKGKVSYKENKVGDPNLDKVVQWIADRVGQPFELIKKSVVESSEKQSAGLDVGSGTKAMQGLSYQGALFNHIQKTIPTLSEDEKIFDPSVFMDMMDKVLMGSKRFHRISNTMNPKKTTPKMTYHPSVGWDMMVSEGLISGSKDAIPNTAWCDSKCVIAFGRDFAEALLQYGEIVGITTKDADYVSNGGKIPDGYAYIEFTIAHELLHYTNGDHMYPERYKIFRRLAEESVRAKLQGKNVSEEAIKRRANSAMHYTINWLGDFINNTQLIKAGFEQLPVGLYSEEINADQGDDYFTLYRKTLKLITDLDEKTKEDQQENSDQHMEDGEDAPKEHGDESEPQDQQEGDDQDGEGGDDQEGDDQDGEGGGQSEQDEIDEMNKENEQNNGGDSGDESEDQDGSDDKGEGEGKSDSSDDKDDESKGDGGSSDSSDLETADIDNSESSDSDGKGESPSGDGKKGSEFSDAEKAELEKLNKEMEQQFDNDNFEKENKGVDIDAKRKEAQKEADNRRAEVDRLQDEKAEEARLSKIDMDKKLKQPSTSWKEIIKRMMSGVLKKEEVWSKMHRTTVANMGSGVEGGTFMRPGDRREKSTDGKRMVFLIDTSYSVGEMMASVNMQILKTIKAGKMKECYIMRFASTEELYNLDIKSGKGYRAKPEWKQVFKKAVVNGPQELDKVFRTSPIKFSEILSTQQTGGTVLSSSTVNLIKTFDKLGFDVIMFTDSDVLWSGNLDNFTAICTKIFKKFTKKNFSLILSADSDYDNVVRALGYGEGNRWISTFKKESNINGSRIGKGHFNN